MASRKRLPEGMRERHAKSCPHPGGACKCNPTYQVRIWVNGDRIEKSFKTFAAAEGWLIDKRKSIKDGEPHQSELPRLRDAAPEWIGNAISKAVLTRKHRPYKPSVIRSYAWALGLELNGSRAEAAPNARTAEFRLLSFFGARRLNEIDTDDIMGLVRKMQAAGLSASTIHNFINPLRVIYRDTPGVVVDPTVGLKLPPEDGKRERIATPLEAAALIAALPDTWDRAWWALGFYDGLRRGESAGLEVEDIDFDDGLLHVRRGWDEVEGEIDEKSTAGKRTLPLTEHARTHLRAYILERPPGGGQLFGDFYLGSPLKRAKRIWDKAGLEPILYHEARHTFASLMIAAMEAANRFNPKKLQYYMGHASITQTFDTYGHLFPGQEKQDAEMLDAYLTAATGAEV